MNRAGIRALVRLDGGPLDECEARALGFDPAPSAVLAQAIDPARPEAILEARDADRVTILLGFVEEGDALAVSLGLQAGVPPATLARAALARFGAETPRYLLGEWSLFDWSPGAVTVMGSLARCDPIFVARRGNRLAIASELAVLRRLAWIKSAIDETGLLFVVGRDAVRRFSHGRTILTGVEMLSPGASLRADPTRTAVARCRLDEPAERFAGSFAEAVEEAEGLLRRIVQGTCARERQVACLLSGGLDSSLTTWLAAQEGLTGSSLTSVAPPGSGLADEAAEARLVADTLGIENHQIVPPRDASPYRPAAAMLRHAISPMVGPRHYLYAEFGARAVALGASALVEGSYGELTVTGVMPLLTGPERLRRLARALLGRSGRTTGVADPFHVRLAPHRLASLPDAIVESLHRPPPPAPVRRPGEAWGYATGWEKALELRTEMAIGGVRLILPYRDMRLLRLFAGFPARFLVQNGLDRAPARTMLAGRLPDAIRLRRRGRPFSPDYMMRLREHAPTALDRIPHFRKAMLDDWLDLDWLEAELRTVASDGPGGVAHAFAVQMTAVTAEYLNWWQEQG